MAPVMPNVSYIHGKILNVRPESDGHGVTWDIEVDGSDDVADYPNFARSLVGRTIEVYVHQDLVNLAVVGDVLRTRIAYRGNERGGRFVLIEEHVQKG